MRQELGAGNWFLTELTGNHDSIFISILAYSITITIAMSSIAMTIADMSSIAGTVAITIFACSGVGVVRFLTCHSR